MHSRLLSILCLSLIVFLNSCGTKNAPLDDNGKSPEQVMMETYQLIIDGDYEAAIKNFSPEYIKEFLTDKNITFEEYCKQAEGWQKEWLRTELVGNDYNENIWRVKIIPDEGKGKENRPGIVQDLHMIDGSWKIVFWNHYPKS